MSFLIDPFERFIDDVTAPTEKGTEPKAIQYIKSITWVAVLLLVLVEIFISIKTGGEPPSKAAMQLPPLNN